MSLLIILRQVELFRGLTDAQREQIGALCHASHLAAGQVLFRQGEPADAMGIIASGQIEIAVTVQGVTTPAIYLGAGQVVGEMGLLDAGARSATARALEDADLYLLARHDFVRLCETNTAIGYLMMRNIAQDLSFKLRHHDHENLG